jgi:hypothetical protein
MATLQQPVARRLDDLSIKAARATVGASLQGVEADVVAAFDTHPELAPLLAEGRLAALSEAALALALRFGEEARVPVFAGAQGGPQFLGELSRRSHGLFSSASPAAAAPSGPPALPRPLAPVLDRLGQHLIGPAWAPASGQPSGSAPGSSGQPSGSAPGSSGQPSGSAPGSSGQPSGSAPGSSGQAAPASPAGLAAGLDLPSVPAIALVFTPERCGDAREVARLLAYASQFPVFWVFVTLGRSDPATRLEAPLGAGAVAQGLPANWCGAPLAPDDDAGVIYPQCLAPFAVWHDHWQRAHVRPEALSAPDDPARPRLTRSAADERTQAVRARAERERVRIARTLEDVERGDAWPRARGPAPKGRVAEPAGPRSLYTHPLVSPEWRLEPARSAGWAQDSDEVGLPGLSPTLTIEGERPALAGPTESSADRLARIRARRLSRHKGR